jgi:hypothetical protein
LIEPIKTEKQALIQMFRAWFDPITVSHLSDHALAEDRNILSADHKGPTGLIPQAHGLAGIT